MGAVPKSGRHGKKSSPPAPTKKAPGRRYHDLHEHLEALKARLLLTIDRRSTRTRSCTRWCAGSSSAALPRPSARRSSSPTSPMGVAASTHFPVLVCAIAASPRDLRGGHGRAAGPDRGKVGPGDRPPDCAARGHEGGLPGGRPEGRRAQGRRQGPRPAADSRFPRRASIRRRR